MLAKIRKWIGTRGGGKPQAAAGASASFDVLFNRFRMFLAAWNRFQEIEKDIEYTLCCDHPFGMCRVRALCTEVSLQVFQCIRQLRGIDPAPCDELAARFRELQKEVAPLVYEAKSCPTGALTGLLCSQELAERPDLISPANARLRDLPGGLASLVPPGFMITGAGCYHILGTPEIEDEVSRRIQAAGGLVTSRLDKLCAGIQDLIRGMPLPDDLVEAVLRELAALRAACRSRGPMRLLLMGRLWPLEEPEEADGLLLWGPSVPLDAPDETVLDAIRATIARKHCPQAMVYRRARGLTQSGTGMCISVFAVEEGCRGGLAHTANPLQQTGSMVHVYFCDGLPEEMESSARPVDVFYVAPREPWQVRARNLHDAEAGPLVDNATVSRVARDAVMVAESQDRAQSYTFLVAPSGALYVLFVHGMRLRSRNRGRVVRRDILGDPLLDDLGVPTEVIAPIPEPLPADGQMDEDSVMPDEGSDGVDALPTPLLTGGSPANPGVAAGHPVVAASWEDIRDLPPHAVLVVRRDEYLWASLVDRVSAIVAEEGLLGSRLGSLCREFGVPAVFGLEGAMERLAGSEWVTVDAGNGCVYPGLQNVLAASALPAVDYMPGSPVYRTLRDAARRIVPPTMDPGSLEFRADSCRTYHDIVSYCHVRAVDAMFALGSGRKQASDRVRQLRDQVLKQFWVVNLGGAFAGPQKGPVVDIENITCVPMRALWQGMNAVPWEGPPPVDGKGFLSVLFEATANPNLDPVVATSYFAEKNYFLASRNYVNLQSRFGFHFISVEARLGSRRSENYVAFHMRGGAADIERRVLRVNFVGDILWEFGFHPDLHNDTLTARLEGMEVEDGRALLAVAGYLTIHTRQLDMIMQDPVQVRRHRHAILEQCRRLFIAEHPLPPEE